MIAELAITVTAQGKPAAPATVPVKELDAAERGGRAFKVAGVLAAIGMGSVFIPVVHFFLPWIMLISAVVAYLKIRGQGAMLQPCSIACAACESAVELPEQPATWPLEWNCPHCKKRLTLQLAGPTAD